MGKRPNVGRWFREGNLSANRADKHEVTSPSSALSPDPGKPPHKPGTQFVARQTILGLDQSVYGYELLFRNGVEDFFGGTDLDAASRSTLNTSLLMGIDVLCDGRRAFINCTRDVLLKDYITLLPPSQVVIEVLETVPADDLVVAACLRMKKAGYLIALDDFSTKDPRQDIAPLADIIKVDLRATSAGEAAAMVNQYGRAGCRMLAEKVETREEFESAKKSGFVYFQGYFFRRPELLTAHEIPANRMNYIRMLKAVSEPELNIRLLENLVKGEAALCYRLLRYMNSAVFGFATEIHSVRHALSILGEREVRRWIRLVATLGAGQNKTTDLVLSALVRARFCELLSPKIQHENSDLFLVGMLSLMDAILEIPMVQVLDSIPIDKESKAVLLGTPSCLRPFYRLMLAQESGEWQAVTELSHELQLAESDVANAHWQALLWAKAVSSGS